MNQHAPHATAAANLSLPVGNAGRTTTYGEYLFQQPEQEFTLSGLARSRTHGMSETFAFLIRYLTLTIVLAILAYGMTKHQHRDTSMGIVFFAISCILG